MKAASKNAKANQSYVDSNVKAATKNVKGASKNVKAKNFLHPWWTLLLSGIQHFLMGNNTHLTFLLAVEPLIEQSVQQVYQRTACLANDSINAVLISQQEGNFKG